MSPFKDKCLELCLYNYVHAVKEKIDKPPEPAVEYQIPMGHVKRVMEIPFLGDGSKSALEHLDFIESLWSLFKLAGIPQDDVKVKLLYLSFSGNARIWFKSLEEEYMNDWKNLKKAFFLKYYTPKAIYEDHCYIYNF